MDLPFLPRVKNETLQLVYFIKVRFEIIHFDCENTLSSEIHT